MAALYYRIWTDAIVSEKAKKAEQRNWKLYTLIPISILMGINLLTFFLLDESYSEQEFTAVF